MLMGGMSSLVKRSCRYLQIVGLVAALALALPLAHGAQKNPAATHGPMDTQAQALIDRTIQALGGPAFLRVKTMTSRGRVFSIDDESTVGVAPYQSYVEYPDKRRFSYGKKQPVILINNGDRAWEIDRYGLTSQPPEQVERWKISSRYSLENVFRQVIREPGILLQSGGVDFVDNVPTRVVDLLVPGGTMVKVDLHRETFLPVRIRYRVRNSKTRDWEDFADVYGDYQNTQGVQTPMHIARYLDGERVSETFRNAVKYDESYPADYFQPTG